MNRRTKLSQHWCGHEQNFSDGKARRVRCAECRKMLTTKAVFNMDGELVGFTLPPHKTKPKTQKRSKGDRGGRHV